MSLAVAYLDSSAIVKLVVAEEESPGTPSVGRRPDTDRDVCDRAN